jgi:hypothetical protein
MTKKIINFFVAEKTMAEYSAKMEPYAAGVAIGKLILIYYKNLLKNFGIVIKNFIM